MVKKRVKHINFFSLGLLFFLTSCSSQLTLTKERASMREALIKKQWPEAYASLEKAGLSKEKNDRLLYLMEKGLLSHYEGRFDQSLIHFEEARTHVQTLYTKSVVNGVTQTLWLEESNDYRGESYEHSLIYYYLVVNHLILSDSAESSEEKQKHLLAARSEILSWDSWLTNLKQQFQGESVFRQDLMIKILGAKVHYNMGTATDRRISLDLIRDAYDVLFRYYNGLPAFNGKFKEFKKAFSHLSTLDPQKVWDQYVQLTPMSQSLIDYLDEQLVNLCFHLKEKQCVGEHRDYLSLVDVQKRIQDKLILKRQQAKESSHQLVAVSLGVGLGLMTEKQADPYNLSLETALAHSKDSPGRAALLAVGIPVLTIFMSETLGLVPPANQWNPPGDFLGTVVTHYAVSNVGFSFELPRFPQGKVTSTFQVLFKRQGESSSAGEWKAPLVCFNLYPELALEALAEHSSWLYTRLASRLGLKYGSAVLAAYGTYQLLTREQNVPPFLAKNAALMQYMASSHLIAQSEKADLRYWSSVPSGLFFADLSLSPGEYDVYLDGGESQKQLLMGSLVVKPQEGTVLKFFSLPEVSVFQP
jgi:hypothetical protein